MAHIQLPPLVSSTRDDRPAGTPPWIPGGPPDSWLHISFYDGNAIGPEPDAPVWPGIPADTPIEAIPDFPIEVEFDRSWTKYPGASEGVNGAQFSSPNCIYGAFLTLYTQDSQSDDGHFLPWIFSGGYPGAGLNLVRRGQLRGFATGYTDPWFPHPAGPYYFNLQVDLYDPEQQIDPASLNPPYSGFSPFPDGIILPARVGIS